MSWVAMAHQKRAVPRMISGNYFLSWDPGVGKTYPVLVAAAFLDYLPSLFIVPAHLREQWKQASDEHTPWRTSVILDKINDKIPDSVFKSADNVIVSYEYAARLPRWKQLRGQEWAAIAIDEAHYLMNGEANRTRAILGAKPLTETHGLVFGADYVWYLTGTPFQFPNQIYPILAASFKGSLKRPERSGPGLMNVAEWEGEYCQFRKDPAGFGEKICGARNIPDLRARLEPFLDKVKIESIHDKPLVVDTIPIRAPLAKLTQGLDPEVLAHYEALMDILEDGDIDDADKLAALNDGGLVMAQLRNHIAATKIKPTVEIVKNELASGQKKILIFGWHKEPLKALAKELKAPLIYGDMSKRHKTEAKERFLDDAPVLIGQISSIGTGTDGLQDVCHRSIFMEASWTYRDNKQAIHRTYRKGQKYPCHTSFIQLLGSIDEYVARVLKRNAEIVGKALD